MSLDDIGTKLYTLENENERLRAKLAGVESCLGDVEPEQFRFAKKTALWMQGFVCAQVACAAAIRKYIDEN